MQYVFALILLVLSSNLALAQAKGDKTLRFFNWNDYMVPEILADFSKETGIKVETPIYVGMEEMLEVLRSGETFDVLVPTHYVLPGLIEEGYLQRLDKRKLPNLRHADPKLMAKLASFDTKNLYAAPYLWGGVGIAINKPQAEAAFGGPLPKSWDLFFDPSLNSRFVGCGISALDAADETLAILLNYKGYSKNASALSIEKMGTILDALRPNLRYVNDERYLVDLSRGKLCLSIAWPGDAFKAQSAGQPVEFFIPREGSALFLDTLVIPANAPNPELAYRFIDYLMRPEVAAHLTKVLFYASFNLEARKFLPPALVKNPHIYPDSQVMRHLYALEPLNEAQKNARDRIWSRFTKKR